MADDYGYFGKGLSGYAHYMQAYKRTQKGSGGGGRPSGTGCSWLLIIVAAVVLIALIKILLD